MRGNSIATRNTRLAAIHSLFRYASLRAPEHAELISRVLGIQTKRATTTIVSFLNSAELDALLAAPDTTTWHGRRDHALLTLTAQTGLRVAELIALTTSDIQLGVGAHVYCRGKGRKDRCAPLTKHTISVLTAWCTPSQPAGIEPLFATRRGTRVSHDAVSGLVALRARLRRLRLGYVFSLRGRSRRGVDDHAVSGILLLQPGLDAAALIDRIPAGKGLDALTTHSAGLLARGRPACGPDNPQRVIRAPRIRGHGNRS